MTDKPNSAIVSFFVPGTPAPQGSKRAFARGNKAWLVETNSKTKPWRDSIAAVALEKYSGKPHACALRVYARFFFQRPKKHFTAKGRFKEDSPNVVSVKPDLDKLQRAVGDALTGIVWRDDSLIWHWDTQKLYCDECHSPNPGMKIEVYRSE